MRYNSSTKPYFLNSTYNNMNISKRYYSTSDLSIENIVNINKMIINGEPIEKISGVINGLLKKLKVYYKYENLPNYIILKGLLSSSDNSFLYNDMKERLDEALAELARCREECFNPGF